MKVSPRKLASTDSAQNDCNNFTAILYNFLHINQGNSLKHDA